MKPISNKRKAFLAFEYRSALRRLRRFWEKDFPTEMMKLAEQQQRLAQAFDDATIALKDTVAAIAANEILTTLGQGDEFTRDRHGGDG